MDQKELSALLLSALESCLKHMRPGSTEHEKALYAVAQARVSK